MTGKVSITMYITLRHKVHYTEGLVDLTENNRGLSQQRTLTAYIYIYMYRKYIGNYPMEESGRLSHGGIGEIVRWVIGEIVRWVIGEIVRWVIREIVRWVIIFNCV